MNTWLFRHSVIAASWMYGLWVALVFLFPSVPVELLAAVSFVVMFLLYWFLWKE